LTGWYYAKPLSHDRATEAFADRANLAPEEREAIEAFEKMANDIANIKEKHKLQWCGMNELCIS